MANNNWRNFGGIYKSEKLSHINVGTLVADQILLRQTQNTVLLVQGEIDVGANATLHGNLFVYDDNYLNKRLYFGSKVAYALTDHSVYLGGSYSGIGINTTAPTSTFDILGTIANSTTLTVRSSTATNKNVIAQNFNGMGITVYTDDGNSSINFANTSYRSSIVNNVASLDLSASAIRINPRTNSNNFFNESAIVFDSSWNPYLYNVYQNATNRTGNALTLVSIDNSSNTALRLVSPNATGLVIKGGGNFPLDASRSYGTIGVNDGYPSINIVSGKNPINYTSTVGINTFSPNVDKYCLDINGPTRIGNGELTTVATLGFDASFVSFSKRSKAGIVSGGPSTQEFPFQNTISYTKDGGLTWTNSIIDTTTTSAMITNPFTICCYSYDSSYAFVGCTSSYSTGIQSAINAIYYTNNGGTSWAKMNDSISSYIYTITSIYAIDTPSTSSKRIFFSGVANNSLTIFYVDVLNNVLAAGNTITFSVDGELANHVTGFSSSFTKISSSDGSGNDLYYVGNGIQHVSVAAGIADMSYNIGVTVNYNNICYYDSSHVVAVGSNIISSTTDGQHWFDVSYTTNQYGSSVLVGNLRDVCIYDPSKAIAVGNGGTMLYTVDGYKSWNPISSQLLNSSGIGSLLTNPNYDLTGIMMPTIDTFVISQVLAKYDPTNSTKGNSRILYGFFPPLFNSANNNVIDVCGNMTIGGNVSIVEGGQLNTNKINVSGDILPTIENSFRLGTAINSFKSLYINKNAFYFTDAGKTLSTLSYNSDTSGLQLITKSDNVVGNVLLSYGGNVALGKLSNAPSYTVDISGIVNINSTIQIASDVSVNTRFFSGGDVSLNSRLYVLGNTILENKVTALTDVSINGNLSLSKLFVTANTTLTGQLNANSDVYANSRLFVTNDTSLNKNVYIAGNTTINQNLFGNGTLNLVKDATFNGNTYTGLIAYSPVFDSNSSILNIGTQGSSSIIYIGNFNNNSSKTINIGNTGDTVILNGNVINKTTETIVVQSKTMILNEGEIGDSQSYGSGIYIRDNSNDFAGYFLVSTDMSGYNFKPPNKRSNNIRLDVNSMVLNGGVNTGLMVLKQSSTMGILDSSYALTLQNIDVSSLLIRNASLSTDSMQVISSIVSLQNDLSASSRLFVAGDTSLNSRLYVSNDVSINSRLFVGNDASLNGRLYVSGNVIVTQGLTALSDVSTNTRLFVAGDTSLNSRLYVSNDLSVNSRLFVGQDASLNGRLYVSGNVIVAQGLTALSDVSTNTRLFVAGDTSLNSRLYVSNDVSVNSRLFVGNDASLNGRLYVAGNVIVTKGLTALSDVSTNNRLFVAGDTSLNSRLFVNNDSSFNKNVFVGSDLSVNGNIFVANNLTMGGVVNFVGLSIGSNVQYPDTTMDISGNIEQLNGAIYQF
uniref:Peptidase S74 domain-containing protein n=1 Tax=viral metagenome TaxID=1070528 RepID=A0A6C0I3Z2_9ZZZZ